MRKMNLNDDIDILEEEQAQREYYEQQRAREYHDQRYNDTNYKRNRRNDYNQRGTNSRKRNWDYDHYNNPDRDGYYKGNYPRKHSVWGRSYTRDNPNYVSGTHRRPFFRRNNWDSSGWGRRTNREGSGQVIFYIILFIAVAVLFKWVILKNTGMTAVATLIVIVVFMGHLRDK